MDNVYQKLEWRLRSIAKGNYQANKENDNSQCSLLYIELVKSSGQIVGWIKPEIKPLEPRNININDLDVDCVLDWNHVVAGIKVKVEGILLIQRGEPIGWLK